MGDERRSVLQRFFGATLMRSRVWAGGDGAFIHVGVNSFETVYELHLDYPLSFFPLSWQVVNEPQRFDICGIFWVHPSIQDYKEVFESVWTWNVSILIWFLVFGGECARRKRLCVFCNIQSNFIKALVKWPSLTESCISAHKQQNNQLER